LTNDYGEIVEFQLPHSGSYFYVSSTYDIGVSGNQEIEEPVLPNITVSEDALKYTLEWLMNSDKTN